MVSSLAPFVPSQPDVVKRMLEVAQVSTKDIVFDLGCGDGRILFAAVRNFGARKAVGYEMRKDLYDGVLNEIKKQNLEGTVRVVNADLLTADISEATVITLYLTTSGNGTLRPKLSKEAKAGTRIVSHDFDFADWSYSKRENFSGHTIYLYTIPDAYKKENVVERKSRSFFPFKWGRR